MAIEKRKYSHSQPMSRPFVTPQKPIEIILGSEEKSVPGNILFFDFWIEDIIYCNGIQLSRW